MSWRIEQANPFALLRELPDGLFQTCLLRVPADLPDPCLWPVLKELFRVTREDGTLWLAGAMHQAAAQEAGWCRPISDAIHPRLHGCGGSRCRTVTLLVKQPTFHFNARLLLLGCSRSGCGPARRHVHLRSRCGRRAWCVPSTTRPELPLRLIDWCIRASTSPRACQVCGAVAPPSRSYQRRSGVAARMRAQQ